MEPLQTEQIHAYYDDEQQIIHVVYRGALTNAVTLAAYRWRTDLYRELGTDNVRAEIFDFRQVTEMKPGNLHAVQTASQELHSVANLSKIPSAVIARHDQRQMLSVALHITPRMRRKHLVADMNEAQAFIDNWHKGAGA